MDVLIGFLLGSLFTWLISNIYYRKSKEDFLKTEKLKQYDQDNFIDQLRHSKWEQKNIKKQTIWVCIKDVRYQISIENGELRDFAEEWTDRFINKKAFLVPVLLKIDNNIFEEINFIYCDEMRYFVPMPEIKLEEGQTERSFYWKSEKLYFLVFQIIGSKSSLENIQRLSGVKVV